MIDELGTTTINNNRHVSVLELVAGYLYGRIWSNNPVQIPTSLSTNTKWTYAALRYNSTSNVMDLFLNGSLVTTINNYSRSIPPAYYIGLGSTDNTNSGSGAYYKGKIAIFRTYNRALSNNEILNNYSVDVTKF